jgi:hypothetical protein
MAAWQFMPSHRTLRRTQTSHLDDEIALSLDGLGRGADERGVPEEYVRTLGVMLPDTGDMPFPHPGREP